MPTTCFKQISKNIKKYRLLNNMTQEDLAAALELDTQYYAQLERAERKFTLDKVMKSCSILHVNIEDIININTGNDLPSETNLTAIKNKLSNLSESQLLILDKFMTEILPYIK